MSKKHQEAVTEIAGDWRSQALRMLPELAEQITPAVNPRGLWIDIGLEFVAAYDEPCNDDLIRRIYGFANWCIEQPRSRRAEDDLFTCVISFYEDVPINKAARLDMTRWFTLEDVRENKQVFSYYLSVAEYEMLLTSFAPSKIEKRKKSHNKKSHNEN